MTGRAGFLCALAAVAMAQAPENQGPANNASVSGTVKDARTGEPMAGYVVSTSVNAKWSNNTIFTNRSTRDVTSTTDAQGRYRLSDLPPGDYRIDARFGPQFGGSTYRDIMLAGHDLDGIDFGVMAPGLISGQVVDENREPMPGMTVYLISREYFQGTLGYFLKGATNTDDRGRYTLSRVKAGRPYMVAADRREQKLPARSDAPLNPKLRRPAAMRTWYPNSPMAETAMPITLRSGEHREGVDIEMKRSPNYCMEGAITSPAGPAALDFSIEELKPTSGVSSGGGMFVRAPGGVTGADGKFRICDLAPGTYRLSTVKMDSQSVQFYGTERITIADRDLQNVRLAAGPRQPLEGEVVWDGEAPDKPVSAKLSLWLEPMLRPFYNGENNSARVDIPGTFSFPSMLGDSYSVRPTVNSPGLYVKDVTYSGRSVLHAPLQLGSAMGGAGLRVVVGHDGGSISVRVADKDGNPIGDAHILIMPAEITSEAMLADVMITGQTNQLGTFTSHTIAPGKYLVISCDEKFDATPESVGKLWRSRNRFTEVELAPNGAAQVTIQPATIE